MPFQYSILVWLFIYRSHIPVSLQTTPKYLCNILTYGVPISVLYHCGPVEYLGVLSL